MAVQLSDDEALEVYDLLNRCQQYLKSQEIARAALELSDKPPAYSPLVERLMDVRNRFGDKVAALHHDRERRAGGG